MEWLSNSQPCKHIYWFHNRVIARYLEQYFTVTFHSFCFFWHFCILDKAAQLNAEGAQVKSWPALTLESQSYSNYKMLKSNILHLFYAEYITFKECGPQLVCLIWPKLQMALGPADFSVASWKVVLTGITLFVKGSLGSKWVIGGAQERSEQKANTSLPVLPSDWHF